MKLVGICGHYGENNKCLDGQTVKTKILTLELEKNISSENIVKIDTHNGKKNFIKIIYSLFLLMIKCKNIIILPAHNSVKIFVPFLVFLNIFLHRNLHYVVIGGWLPKILEKRRILKYAIKKFNYIYVETNTMKNKLNKIGINNVVIMPNFKKLNILREKDLNKNHSKPYKLCIFSRIMYEKGIEDAVNAVIKINEESNEYIYSLDIYGQIDKKYEEKFNELKTNFPEYINYRGKIDFDKSVDVLKEYYLLLFPTRFYTEGVPGTIIDAYSAGVPVISSKWESFDDVIKQNITGIGYDFDDNEGLYNILKQIINKEEKIFNMKNNCIKEAKKYFPNKNIKILLNNL